VVIVGSISNEGHKITARDIDRTVVVEVVPLRQEDGERVKLKNLGANRGCCRNGTRHLWRDGWRCGGLTGSMADGRTTVD
jgi:hypothetical protein